MKKNFNRKKQNKDDFNFSISWSISNTRLKNYPVLIYSGAGENFAYVDRDERIISDFLSWEIIYDKVVKNFNILESEKTCLEKCMCIFSVKDLYTLCKSNDFAKFIAKYNFELHVESGENLSRYLKYLNFVHYNI